MSRLEDFAPDGMRIVAERDHRDLTSADVGTCWQRRKGRVVLAFHNFAALRFIRLPSEGRVDRVIEASLRDVVNAVGRKRDLSKTQRAQVYDAALVAFVGLPLGMALPNPFGILDEFDRIAGGDPEISAAVLEVWSIVDDRQFWVTVGKGEETQDDVIVTPRDAQPVEPRKPARARAAARAASCPGSSAIGANAGRAQDRCQRA